MMLATSGNGNMTGRSLNQQRLFPLRPFQFLYVSEWPRSKATRQGAFGDL
jgi:hypothetical protein